MAKPADPTASAENLEPPSERKTLTMDDPNSISQTVTLAFAAVSVVVWTGLFAYLMRLAKKIDRLESETSSQQSSP